MNKLAFDELLQESVKVHGHLCPGQVLGVRMSMLGLKEIGIGEPKGRDRKNLLVFVEIDRCATDAIQSVTGCCLGKRTMKFMDYGKMAATFVNLGSGRAVRVLAREEARELALGYFPQMEDKYRAQLEAYKVMPDAELFETSEVHVVLKPEDMPGRPLKRVRCASCGEYVQDMRDIQKGGRVLCKPCADGGYYSEGFFSPHVMQKSHNGFEVKSKLWLEMNGQPLFGQGRMHLLKAIEKHGSINQAAKEMNISYRKAWGFIKTMEDRLGMKLVECHAGGRHGGGASLTPEVKEFLDKYDLIEKDVRTAANEKFRQIFG